MRKIDDYPTDLRNTRKKGFQDSKKTLCWVLRHGVFEQQTEPVTVAILRLIRDNGFEISSRANVQQILFLNQSFSVFKIQAAHWGK